MDFNYLKLALYNRDELISKLGIDHILFTDKTLLLKAYQSWGEAMFSKINGDFALSFYDRKRKTLYAARDFLGVKALYYIVSGGEYYFSHNIGTLFSLAKIDKKPNLKSVRRLLSHRAVDYVDTMYENVYRVPAGHYLKVLDGQETLLRYWYPEKINTNYTISLKDAATKFKDLFEKAILSRVGNARVGNGDHTAYELSGGLDSSSIVSLLKKNNPQQKVDTYSMCFKGMHCDEYEYIGSVEEKYGFHTTKIASESIDYSVKYDLEFNHTMNPHWPMTTTFTMMFPMVHKMKTDGKKIIITGQGGDHVLTGSRMVLGSLLQRGLFKQLLKELWSAAYPMHYIPFYILYPLLNPKMKKRFKKVKEREYTDLFQMGEMDSFFKKSTINTLLSPAQAMILDGNALHALEEVYSVEFRHPFYDKNLVEFVLSMPPEYLYSQGWIKMLLRYSMEDILPDKIRSRRDKADFTEIISQQIEAIDYKKLFLKSNLVLHGLIKQKEIDRLVYLFENKNNDELLLLWTIVNLEYWYEKIKNAS